MLADALFGKNDLHSWCVYGCNWDVRTIKAVICIICLRFKKQPPVETCFRNRSLFTFSVDFLHRHGAVRRDPLWCHRLYRLVDVEVFGAEDRRQVRPVRTEQKQAGASDCWDLSSKLGCDNWTCVSKRRKFGKPIFWTPSQGCSFRHKVACLIVQYTEFSGWFSKCGISYMNDIGLLFILLERTMSSNASWIEVGIYFPKNDYFWPLVQDSTLKRGAALTDLDLKQEGALVWNC